MTGRQTKAPHYDFDAMQLRPSIARAALADVTRLEAAFIWDRTPQGREYWERQAANGLDEHAYATVAYMIAESLHMEFTSQFFRRAA